MKKIEILKENKLIIPILTNEYNINTYGDTVEITCKDEIERTYIIPINKGYKIIVEI